METRSAPPTAAYTDKADRHPGGRSPRPGGFYREIGGHTAGEERAYYGCLRRALDYRSRGAVIFTDFGFAAGPLGSDAQGKNGVPSGNIAVFRA